MPRIIGPQAAEMLLIMCKATAARREEGDDMSAFIDDVCQRLDMFPQAEANFREMCGPEYWEWKNV